MTVELTTPTDNNQRTLGIWFISILALIFGLLTIKSATAVLFFSDEARQAAGNYVPFVLWFNFVAGIFYIITGVRLWLMKTCVVWLAIAIAGTTLLVFSLLGLHIFTGGAYELRTVQAMSLRSVVWLAIAIFIWQRFHRTNK